MPNSKSITSFLLLLVFLIFAGSVSWAQASTQKPSKVHLKNFDVMRFNQKINPDAQLLVGKVAFQHENMLMYCDSAYFNQDKNSLDAYGHVHIISSDTLHIYSDQLFYSGDQKIARFRNHVRTMNINSSEVLTTDSLDYDRTNDVGYYFNGGRLVDSANVLTSVIGEYHPKIKTADFYNTVHLNNKDFDLYNDTLHYNTETKVATIDGPTNIFTKDTTHIYAEKGYYNTLSRYSELQQHAAVYSKEHTIKGDLLQYNEELKEMHAFGNVFVQDTLEHLILTGEKGYFNQLSKHAMMSDSALCMEYSTPDTFYIHADHLEAKTDSTYKLVFAYHHTRFYRVDVQGKCDSMVVITRDSVVKMYQNPMLWSGENQINGDSIFIYAVDGALNRLEVLDNAFVISRIQDSCFNQIKGNKVVGHVQKNELTQLDVDGSVQMIYFPLEDSIPIGMNVCQSSYMKTYFIKGKMDRTIMNPKSNGTIYPLHWIDAPSPFLVGYYWGGDIRPRFPMDVFRIPIEIKKTEDDL